jgi:hypothetical protein
MGDFGEPFKIHQFANDVFAGYSMVGNELYLYLNFTDRFLAEFEE